MCCVSPVKKIFNKINYLIDPRIELIASIQLISDYGSWTNLITTSDFEYKSKMINYFSPYANHKAVKKFEILSKKGLNFDAPHNLMLYLTNPPIINYNVELDEPIINRISLEGFFKDKEEIVKEVNEFIDYLNDYCADTKFVSFFESNVDFYNSILDENTKIIGETSFINDVENYYGMTQNSYNIIFTPTLLGGYGIEFKSKSTNGYDVYTLLGVSNVQNSVPKFINLTKLKSLVWHEFSHTFINPVTCQFRAAIEKYECLFDPIKKQMTDLSYGNWETCINEHLIRALTIRFSYIKDGVNPNRALYNEKKKGFYYIDLIYNKLQDYELNRKKFPTFKDFYVNLIEVFSQLSKMNLIDFYKLKFKGGINDVVKNINSLFIILPSNELDKEQQNEFNSKISSSFIEKGINPANIITDNQAINMNLSDKCLYVYGTINGNLWMDKYKELFPFVFNCDNLIFNDKKYIGEDLSLVCSIPNPEDEFNGVNLYTSQKFDDILNTRNNFIPFTDFIICKGQKVLASGEYLL